MADKPSKGLIIYGYGLAPLIKPFHSHFHDIASIASCAFLSLHYSSSILEREDGKLIRELAQLLDANEAIDDDSGQKGSDSEASQQTLSMSERFMGMRAAVISGNSDVKRFGEKLGFSVIEFDKLTNGQSSDFGANELLKLLGFQDGKILDKDQFDLVLLHIGAHDNEYAGNDLEYANNLVGRILQVAQPGSEVASRLHLSLVMSYGAAFKDDPDLSLESLADTNNSDLRRLFPRQSYTLKGVDLRNHIRHHCPMLVAQWQDAVTRKDTVQEFSFEEFKKVYELWLPDIFQNKNENDIGNFLYLQNSGNLAIAADRFIYEVAFKMWKAPKYGA